MIGVVLYSEIEGDNNEFSKSSMVSSVDFDGGIYDAAERWSI
jgi:hypothetical protein